MLFCFDWKSGLREEMFENNGHRYIHVRGMIQNNVDFFYNV